jgi:hypothetical protein
MTEQQIKDRITELTNQAKSMEINLVAVQGAIQDCQWWLKQLESKDAPQEIDQPQGV